MDILQHALGQIILVIILQFFYLEIPPVSCFAWVGPSQARSQSVPAETHIISQRWHQSIPKWYPYNMWKKRKRKEPVSNNLLRDTSFGTRPLSYNGRVGTLVSKYQKLMNKLNRKKHVNSIVRHDSWKSNHQSSRFEESFGVPKSDPVPATTETVEENQYHSPNHKAMFGRFNPNESFSPNPAGEPTPEAKKKIKSSKQSGFGNDGFDQGFSDGFEKSDGFKPMKASDEFSGDFVPVVSQGTGKIQNKADTAAKTSTGFANDPFATDAGSWGESSWSDSGSFNDDGFGTVVAGTDQGSWGEAPEGTDGFSSFGGGSFSDDTKDCDTILTKSCSDSSECSCYGLYSCSNNRCAPLSSAPETGSSSMGSWGEEPVSFGSFAKRKDPRKLVQIFMLPWQPEK